MALSPLAEIYKNSMRQTCTLYRYGGADPTGQPVYGQGEQLPCRLAIKTERSFSDTVTVLLPASAAIGAYDRLDLPAPYQQGAIIREVVTATDQWGRTTHQVVRIQ